MNILLVYPKFEETFWSLKYALRFILKKANVPPLGLLTIAALLPKNWNKKLVDMNVSKLHDKDIKWADFVFISAIDLQRKSVKDVIQRCKNFGKKIVAGGPLFTTSPEDYKDIDHLVLNEGEVTLPMFLADLEKEGTKHMYTSSELCDITKSPPPMFELINMKNYASMCIQYSRGCPFNCDFCSVPVLFGRVPRVKTAEQIIGELDNLYMLGWRGNVFFVDDNFIGNKKDLKMNILPAIAKWMQERKYPFEFITQASINLADDVELMKCMSDAGFNAVFIGIETPEESSLTECGKLHNRKRDMLADVQKIHNHGLQVHGGFIIGFDSDTPLIFKKMAEFIQRSGVVTAMIGLLNALRGTKLYQRLKVEGRLLSETSGNNCDCSINFIPAMNYKALIEGYKKLVKTVYSPRNYYKRVRRFIKEYKMPTKLKFRLNFLQVFAFFKSILHLGVISRERFHYWRLLSWTLIKQPKFFALAITMAILGFHFRKIYSKYQK